MAKFTVERLDHVAIDVADVDRSRAFYTNVLGIHSGEGAEPEESHAPDDPIQYIAIDALPPFLAQQLVAKMIVNLQRLIRRYRTA